MDQQQLINQIKGLVIDGVDRAQSGHPGGAMSSAAFATLLWQKYLSYDPDDPKWMGRDRFVLSAGHESMLLYALLYAVGWLERKDLEQFRQLESRTPGHPENDRTPGVECTTGPLGQGAAMSVGFALAAKHLAAKFGDELFGNLTFALLGDGCIQEDVTLGAASLAGHFRLNKLIWYYDKNSVQISGKISRATSTDDAKVFEGLGWRVCEVDGHDLKALSKILDEVTSDSQKGQAEKPLLIIGNSTIAHGAATLEGQAKTHGSPLPKDERIASKKRLGIPDQEDFYFPEESRTFFASCFADRKKRVQKWQAHHAVKMKDSQFAKDWQAHFGPMAKDFPKANFKQGENLASRSAFGRVLEAWADQMPRLIGGSADLEPSNMTHWFAAKVGDFQAENPRGRNLAFGVREFPMSAICNGLALYGGLLPFDATFLSFADYSRAALRLGAIQHAVVIHEFTHDSFYLGEDGPTHQAVEQLMSLRLIPNFYVFRPADSLETQNCMEIAAQLKAPSAFCLSRQNLRDLNLDDAKRRQVKQGAYILEPGRDPEYIIFASGSEVSLAMDLAKLLGEGKARVVSTPCWELFFEQDQKTKDQILDWSIRKRISIEAGSTLGWQAFVGHQGLSIGLDRFGESGPAENLAKYFGFTPDAVLARVQKHFL